MFYIIESKEQFDSWKNEIEEKNSKVFIKIIKKNNNIHDKLNDISLIYVRPINDYKGYILGINHNEIIVNYITKEMIIETLLNTSLIYLNDKKESLYYFPELNEKIVDCNTLNFPESYKVPPSNRCIQFYYGRYPDNPYINTLIPIGIHYELCEEEFLSSSIYFSLTLKEEFNTASKAFYDIEKNGIKLNKDKFLHYFGESTNQPEFNIAKGKIYTNYNLYTTTSRPSNSFNNINFAAFSKSSGEKECFVPENDIFVELDISSYHPRIIGELMDFSLPNTSIYEYLGIKKEDMFHNLYGSISDENLSKSYFREVKNYSDKCYKILQDTGEFKTKNRTYKKEKVNTPQKLLSYIIQSYETYNNILILSNLNSYMSGMVSKIVLYTYDAFLIDFSFSEYENHISNIKEIIKFPVKVKEGYDYHNMK